MTDDPVGAGPQIEVLESDVRLSRSLFWGLQEDYFATHGIDAWNAVPFHATSSAFICDAYADMVVAFLLDYAPYLDREAPLWLLELGAGTGCFSWRFLRALRERTASFRALADLDLRYVMTDFTPKIVDTWLTNPSLKPLLDDGILDVAVYRPAEASSFDLRRSGRTMSVSEFRNPAIIFANYVFDTLRHDAFRIDRGALYEVRITLSREARDTPVSLDQLKSDESFVPVSAEHYYDEPGWNLLLERYRTEMDQGSVIIPLGGLETVRQLRSLTGSNFALFVVDKGYGDSSMMQGLWRQEYATHGSTSFMVNFDAIASYVEHSGGRVLRDRGTGFDLVLTMNAITPSRSDLESSRHFFEHTLRSKNPFNALHYVYAHLGSRPAEATAAEWIKTVLSVLQTCSCDPQVFARWAQHLEAEREAMDDHQSATLRHCLDRVRDNLYVTDRTPAVLAPLLRLYYHLGDFDASLEVCELHLASLPTEAWILGYVALCHEAKGRLDVALSYLKRYRALAPDDPWLKDALNRVRSRLLTESTTERQ